MTAKEGRAAQVNVPKKPTLKTIAELSGLAVPTVSRALNDAPDIGKSTKELVRRIADEIGYVPNRAGVRLRTGRTNVISLVLSTEHDMMNYTARLISSTAAAMQGTRFHLNVTPYFPEDDPMKPIRYIVETGSADAVIINQIQPEDPRVQYLMERSFPFASHGRTKWANQHTHYDFDNAAFGRIGVEELHRRGRRNVLLIAPRQDQNYSVEMIAGARGAAERLGVHMAVAEGATSDDSNDHVQAAVSDYLRGKPETDGIVVGATAAAMASVAGLESLGHAIGKDIDLVAKEAVPLLNFFRPGIIAVREDIQHAGKFLAEAAMRAVREPEAPPMQGLEVPLLPEDCAKDRT